MESALRGLRDAASRPGSSEANLMPHFLRCAEAYAAKGDLKKANSIYDSLRRSAAGHQVRTAALRGAILTGRKNALPLLTECLASPDYAVFSAAVRASLELPGDAATAALANALAKPPADRQVLLTQALGQRGDDGALQALVTAAKSYAPTVRVAAIRAVAELGRPSVIPALQELMSTGEPEVSQAAQEALASLPGKEAEGPSFSRWPCGLPGHCHRLWRE